MNLKISNRRMTAVLAVALLCLASFMIMPVPEAEAEVPTLTYIVPPIVSDPAAASFSVSGIADIPVDAELELGTTPDFAPGTGDVSFDVNTFHGYSTGAYKIQVTLLNPSTTYHWRLKLADASNPGDFIYYPSETETATATTMPVGSAFSNPGFQALAEPETDPGNYQRNMLYVLRVDGCYPLTLVETAGFVQFSASNLRNLDGTYHDATGSTYNIEAYGYWDSGTGINPPSDFWYNDTASFASNAGGSVIPTSMFVVEDALNIDSIAATDAPNGTKLVTVELPVGGSVLAYASGYNTESEYMGLVNVTWDGLGGVWDNLTGNSSTFTAGMVAGTYLQTIENTTLGLNYIFNITVLPPTADYINITDAPDGTALRDIDPIVLSVGGTYTAYASGYNVTAGYVGLVEVDWTGLGGAWAPLLANTSTYTAGLVAGLYTQTGENVTLNVSDSFDIQILEATVDSILLTDAPNGNVLGDPDPVDVPVGGTLVAYASGYNVTAGYVGLVEVDWSGLGGAWAPLLANTSTYTAGLVAGLYTQTGENVTLGVSDSFDIQILEATVDSILLTDTPNGNVLGDPDPVDVPVGGTLVAYASGYNVTAGYIGLVEVDWSGLGGAWAPLLANTSTFTAGDTPGLYTQTGENATLGVSDTFVVNVVAVVTHSTINLVEGWNLISLDRKDETGSLSASKFANDIDNTELCLFIVMWDGSGYMVYDRVGGSGDFEMVVGYGYWVYMTDISIANIWGFNKSSVGSETYNLNAGSWNLVGWFNDTGIQASVFVNETLDDGYHEGARGFVTPWDAGSQLYGDGYLEVYIYISGSWQVIEKNDFEMIPQHGYWIWVETQGTVTY